MVNCWPAVKAGNVIVLVSLLPNALAALPEIPVTPTGFEGGVVSRPRPKSDPCTVVESYQIDKFLPSGVVSVKPPFPLSPANTPWTLVPALILSITYWRRWLWVWPADKLNETFSPLTYKSVWIEVVPTVVLVADTTAGPTSALTPVKPTCEFMAAEIAMALPELLLP